MKDAECKILVLLNFTAVVIMSQYSPEEMINIARVLVNLGHCYLQTTSVENSEDESDEEEEENNQPDPSKTNGEPVIGVQSAEYVQDNVEEKMQTQNADELRLVENYEQLEFDDECNVNVQQKSYLNRKKQDVCKKGKHKKFDGRSIQTCINNKVPDRFSNTRQKTETGSERHEETLDEIKNNETQVSLEHEQVLDEKITEHFEKNQQMKEEDCIEIKLDIEVDPDFDQELNENEPKKLDCNNQLSNDILIELNIEVLEDLVTQQILDENLTQEKQRNVEENKKTKFKDVKQIAVNREPDTKRNQIQFSENIEVQNDNEMEQEFNDNDTLAKLQNEFVLLEPELDTQREKTNKNIEKIKKDIQLKIDKLTTELLNGNKNVNNAPQPKGTIEESIEQIQQEIKILKMESDEFDFNQDEELEKEVIEKLNKICSNSNQVNFFENLVSLFDQDSSAIQDKINSLCNKYFQEFDNSSLTDSVEIANVEMIQKINRILKQDEEVNQKLTNEMPNSVGENLIQMFEKDNLSEFSSQNQKESQVNIDETNKVENKGKSQKYEVIPEEDLLKNFDVVITYNSNIQEKNNETEQDISEKVKIQFNEELLKKLQEDALKNQPQPNDADLQSEYMINNFTNNTIQQYVDKQIKEINCEPECNKENQQIELYEDTQLEVDEEIELDLSEKMQIDNNKQLPQRLNKKTNEKSNQDKSLHLEIDFFRKTQDHRGSQGIQNETFIELFKKELLNNSRKISQELVENTHNPKIELLDESDVCSEKSKEILKLLNPTTDEYENKAQDRFVGGSQEESDVDVDEFEEESYKHFVEKFKKIKDKYEFNNSESDVDIEGLEYEPQCNLRTEIQREPEKLETSNFNNSDEPLLKNNNAEFEKFKSFKEINEVVELVEDYEIESDISENNRTNIDLESSLVKKYPEEYSSFTESSSSEESSLDINPFAVEYSSSESSLVDKFNSTYLEIGSEEEKLKSTEELLSSDKDGSNSTKELCSLSDSEEINDGDIRHFYINNEEIQSSEESLKEVENEQQKFEIEDYSHGQFKRFQKDFYKDLKREYDKELPFKVTNKSNPEVSQDFDKQQQTFYELKDEFRELKQDYKSCMQQKIFEQLEKDVDGSKLLDVKNFPEQYDDKENVIDKDIHNEFAELQRECSLLEPEFKYNVPFDFDEESIGPSLKPKQFNLFSKLYSIHRQKLCQFVNSKTWPEYCLYPSSLLDCLFEDPLEEVKPNVLVITLYPINVGYSIKITMKKDDPPIETFFNYADDSVLSYIEKEELPPHLLEVLDQAEPRLFYNGCVIAEIYDQINGVPAKLYRILLRPSSLSIQTDINRIIANNSKVNWTYKRRLKLEQTLTLAYRPIICMDSSPIAGLAVQLQHQLLSWRTIRLNPLKYKHTSSNTNLPEKDLPDNLLDNEFLSKPLDKSAKSMNVANDGEIHYLLWKFNFCLKSVKHIKLYVSSIKETQDYFMVLSFSKNFKSTIRIRVKVNYETHKCKSYINLILDILKKKISPDMKVVRSFKKEDKSPDRCLYYVPPLFSDKTYDPNYTDFNELIDKLLEDLYEYQPGHQNLHTDFESIKNQHSAMSLLLPCVVKKTDEAIKRLEVNKQVDQTTNQNIHVCTSTKLKDDSTSCFEPSVEQTTTNYQLDRRKRVKYDDLLESDTSSSSSSKKIECLNEENKESKTTLSSSIDDDRGVKRKQTMP